MGERFVRWISNLDRDDASLAGDKGANLGEIFRARFPVPQAFVVTTEAFKFFLDQTGLEDKIKSMLKEIDVDNTYELRRKSEDIRSLIVSTGMPQVLEDEVLEAYDNFNIDLSGLKDSPGALAILKSAREPVFVSVRSSATLEDGDSASFAGQQDSFINVKGNRELIDRLKKVFASIFTARSIYYRVKKGFNNFASTAVVVQKMINAEKSGIIFSRHPIKGTNEILIESVWGLGEGIVSGKIKPDQHVLSRELELVSEHISDKKLAVIRNASGQTKTVEIKDELSAERVLKTHELKSLADIAIKLESLYGTPQDVEFAIENHELFILQTRPITTLNSQKQEQNIDGQLVVFGQGASQGVASGTVRIVRSIEDLDKVKEGDVLVTKMTTPDMVVIMKRVAAIVTSEGGVTSHAAIVSREMGIPAVVGAEGAVEKLKDGMDVTVDGSNGKVFSGATQNQSVEVKPIVQTETKIKVIVDLPKFAERAAQTQAEGIGLIRLSSIIASAGKHPLYYESNNKLGEYESLIKNNLKEIAEKFIGKSIWVQTSDIRSDEYSDLEGTPKIEEKNPILGNHGIKFSLKHEPIFRAELRAIRGLCDLGHHFGVMFPQVTGANEVRRAKTIFDEEGCGGKVKIGVVVETPAAAVLIKDILEIGLDFVSFGTNDLTQYTLAVDKNNMEVSNYYDELNWAVLKQISRVIRECKSHGVETSICGQAASNVEMIKFLVRQKIDSITVNADVAYDISEHVKMMEDGEEDMKLEKEGGSEALKVKEEKKKESISDEVEVPITVEAKEEDEEEVIAPQPVVNQAPQSAPQVQEPVQQPVQVQVVPQMPSVQPPVKSVQEQQVPEIQPAAQVHVQPMVNEQPTNQVQSQPIVQTVQEPPVAQVPEEQQTSPPVVQQDVLIQQPIVQEKPFVPVTPVVVPQDSVPAQNPLTERPQAQAETSVQVQSTVQPQTTVMENEEAEIGEEEEVEEVTSYAHNGEPVPIFTKEHYENEESEIDKVQEESEQESGFVERKSNEEENYFDDKSESDDEPLIKIDYDAEGGPRVKVEEAIQEVDSEAFLEDLAEKEEERREEEKEQVYIIDQHKRDYHHMTLDEVKEEEEEERNYEDRKISVEGEALRELGAEIEKESYETGEASSLVEEVENALGNEEDLLREEGDNSSETKVGRMDVEGEFITELGEFIEDGAEEIIDKNGELGDKDLDGSTDYYDEDDSGEFNQDLPEQVTQQKFDPDEEEDVLKKMLDDAHEEDSGKKAENIFD